MCACVFHVFKVGRKIANIYSLCKYYCLFNCLLIWSFSRALFLRVSIILWKRSTVKSEEQSRSRKDFVSLCGTEVPWIFIRRSLPPCFSKPCAYKCVLCMCVCVCTRTFYFFLCIPDCIQYLIFMYLMPLWGESGFQWIAEVCFVCWNKKKAKWEVFIKMFNDDISGHLPLKIDVNPAVTFSFLFFSSQWVLLRWCFNLGLPHLINCVIALWKDLDTNNKWVKHHSLQYLAKINSMWNCTKFFFFLCYAE